MERIFLTFVIYRNNYDLVQIEFLIINVIKPLIVFFLKHINRDFFIIHKHKTFITIFSIVYFCCRFI